MAKVDKKKYLRRNMDVDESSKECGDVIGQRSRYLKKFAISISARISQFGKSGEAGQSGGGRSSLSHSFLSGPATDIAGRADRED